METRGDTLLKLILHRLDVMNRKMGRHCQEVEVIDKTVTALTQEVSR